MPEQMEFAEFANLLLTWVGFGTLVGLVAKSIMPGPDPGGTVATLLMGIVGTLIGCAVLKFIYPNVKSSAKLDGPTVVALATTFKSKANIVALAIRPVSAKKPAMPANVP